MDRKQAIYPVEPWTITETRFDPQYNYRNETTFALSNGYIGTRGTFEESYPFDIDTGLEGNFINGFYESEEIRYGEANFGSPLRSQSLLNLPNLKETRLILGDESFDMNTGHLGEYRRTLNMQQGVLTRTVVWTSPGGKKVTVEISRFTALKNKNLIAMQYRIHSHNYSGPAAIVSRLDAAVENHTRKTNPIVDYGPFGRRLEPQLLTADREGLFYQGRTCGSGLTMACGSIHHFDTEVDSNSRRTELQAETEYRFTITGGDSVCLEKFICYSSEPDQPARQLEPFVRQTLRAAQQRGYQELAAEQRAGMAAFWEYADVEIEGDDALLQGIRFNLFHIMQAAGRDGRTGMGAKGLSGEGYEGHYFWDTEMYILPVFIYTQPELARKLLDYRFHTLDQARARASVLGHPCGALFPWRTINGEEASTYYPLGTAQYHINADIAYALQLYVDVTGDYQYLIDKGGELLIETARVWADVGSFAACRDDRYCICSVTGPDEYNVLVDNNFYTNLMARENLRDAAKAVAYIKSAAPEQYSRLVIRLKLQPDEPAQWLEIAERMYFPYDDERQVYPLDDGFMIRKPWDEERIPPEKRAWLYENYHPLFIMRHRMSKQADSILGMYLHSNYFTPEELQRNYDFYQEVTLHHSSLSTSVFGLLACEIGNYDEAFRYFSDSARMDLDDYHNNFYAGIHAANMAGTWLTVVNGFAGLRVIAGELHFKPFIPADWRRYQFKIRYRGCTVGVTIDRQQAALELVEGTGLKFRAGGQQHCLAREGEVYIEKI